MISVLMFFRRFSKISLKTAASFPFSSLAAGFPHLTNKSVKTMKDTCEKIRRNPLRQKNKNRDQNASLTAEASLAFPVFFFAVVYLIQMFHVLRAETVIAEAGFTSAREAAAYGYAAERLADGENATADKLLEVFNHKLIRDATMTGLFYLRCDEEVLQQAGVAQGLSGVRIDSEEEDEKIRAEIWYKVTPANVLRRDTSRYYTMRIVYRNWTGEGETTGKDKTEANGDIVYMTEHGRVYHRKRTCRYIKIDVRAVLSEQVAKERNRSGGKYYACEFCDPVLKDGIQMFLTEYGTRFHCVSTCSAIARNVTEYSLKEIEDTYPPCSRCGEREEGET